MGATIIATEGPTHRIWPGSVAPRWRVHENTKIHYEHVSQSLKYSASSNSVESWDVRALITGPFPLSCSKTWWIPSPSISFDSSSRTSLCLFPETIGVFAADVQWTTAWTGKQRRRPAPEDNYIQAEILSICIEEICIEEKRFSHTNNQNRSETFCWNIYPIAIFEGNPLFSCIAVFTLRWKL